jgi:hypothetical protein
MENLFKSLIIDIPQMSLRFPHNHIAKWDVAMLLVVGLKKSSQEKFIAT